MSPARLLASWVVALAMLVAPVSTASAEPRRVPDKVGDAPAAFDIRWVRYSNGGAAARFTVKVDTLRHRTRVGGYLAEAGDYDGYEFRAWRTSAGVRKQVNYTYGASGARRVRCRGMSAIWHPGRDVIQVRMPRLCLRHVDGRLRMAASTSAPGRGWSSVDDAREVKLAQD